MWLVLMQYYCLERIEGLPVACKFKENIPEYHSFERLFETTEYFHP